MARYREIPRFDDLFVDLNRDDVSPVQKFAVDQATGQLVGPGIEEP